LCATDANARLYASANLGPDGLNGLSWESRKIPELLHHRLFECRTCDLVYANPAPKPDVIRRAYEDAPFAGGEESKRAARTYAGLVRPLLRGFTDKTGALDVGTGDGAFLAELLAAGFSEVAGIEPSRAPRESARDGLRELIRPGFFKGSEFPPASMRLVTCFMTLEHLPDPLAFCRAARALLKADGVLLVTVHDRRAVLNRVMGTRSPILDVEHLQLFSPRSVTLALSRAGYTGVKVWKYANTYPLRYWIRMFPFPAAVKDILGRMAEAVGAGRLPVSLPAGNIVAVGVNPSGTAS
jgi:SAM-dependent methyltransferase